MDDNELLIFVSEFAFSFVDFEQAFRTQTILAL
jgi:hypothetical protein